MHSFIEFIAAAKFIDELQDNFSIKVKKIINFLKIIDNSDAVNYIAFPSLFFRARKNLKVYKLASKENFTYF
jgi:hypothetical protein